MADHFIALYDFHRVIVHGVVKLSFSNKWFSDQWLPCALINMISAHNWCEREDDGGLLRDSAQAFSNIFFWPSKAWILEQLTKKSAFWTSYFFFFQIMLESWVCGLYTSVYVMCPWICIAIDVTLLGQNSTIHAINVIRHFYVERESGSSRWMQSMVGRI